METIDEFAEVMKILSDPTRLRLIRLLCTPVEELSDDCCCGGNKFYCVNALAEELGVSQSAVSQHLRVLRQARLVRGKRWGKFMHYEMDRKALEQFNEAFNEILKINNPRP